MSDSGQPIPLTLVTGFLGSGKTTLLNALLRHPDFAGTAVLVNEIGSVGIDHSLVVGASDDVLLLEGGCLCCQPKGSIADGVSRLLAMQPPPQRIVIETSGAANPLPVLESLSQHPRAGTGFRFPRVVTLVDCVLAGSTLDRHAEAGFQICAADLLVLTKTDIAGPGDRAAADAILASTNPTAARVVGAGATLPDGFVDLVDRPLDPSSARGERAPTQTEPAHASSEFTTVALQFDGCLDAADVQSWIDQVLGLYASNILRIKGILNVSGLARPAALQCVRDIVHPIELIDPLATDGTNTTNSIVAIGWDMHPELLSEALGWLADHARQSGRR